MPKSNYDIVKNNLGKQTADAIRGMIIDEIAGLREEVIGLVGRQEKNIEVAEVEGSPEATASVDDATRAVQEADQAVEEAKADPTPVKAEKAKGKVKQATMKVDQAESELAALTETVERHEIILAPWQKDERMGDRPKSRFDNIEDEIVGMRGEMDQTAAASAEALAIARSSQGGPSLWIVAVVTFLAAFGVLSTMAAFNSLTVFWDAVWLAVATTAFVTIVAAVLDHLAPTASESISQAKAKAKARRSRENDDILPGGDGPRPMNSAEAEAAARVAAGH